MFILSTTKQTTQTTKEVYDVFFKTINDSAAQLDEELLGLKENFGDVTDFDERAAHKNRCEVAHKILELGLKNC